MRWSNVQFLFFQPLYTGNVTFATNGPTYDIKGVELQAVARPFEGVTLQGAATYNENTEASSPCLTGNIANNPSFGKCITEANGSPYPNPYGQVGSQAALSPNGRATWAPVTIGRSTTIWLPVGRHELYQPHVQSAGELRAGHSGTVPSTTYLRYYIPGYTTFDAQIGVEKDKWHFEFFGENLATLMPARLLPRHSGSNRKFRCVRG